MFDAQEFARRLAHRQDRWSLFKDFVAEWHAPLQDRDGYSADELDAAERRLGLTLPLALRELYTLAGRRKDIMATQNFLVSPEELTVQEENGLLEFFSENQQVVMWGLKPEEMTQDDPPVWLDNSGQYTTRRGLVRENDTISEFALHMAVFHTISRLRVFAGQRIKPEVLADVEQRFVRLGFPDWHWPCYPTQFYGGRGALLKVVGEQHLSWAARTQVEQDRIVVLLNFTTDN